MAKDRLSDTAPDRLRVPPAMMVVWSVVRAGLIDELELMGRPPKTESAVLGLMIEKAGLYLLGGDPRDDPMLLTRAERRELEMAAHKRERELLARLAAAVERLEALGRST